MMEAAFFMRPEYSTAGLKGGGNLPNLVIFTLYRRGTHGTSGTY
jgi:hypothetical protein